MEILRTVKVFRTVRLIEPINFTKAYTVVLPFIKISKYIYSTFFHTLHFMVLIILTILTKTLIKEKNP